MPALSTARYRSLPDQQSSGIWTSIIVASFLMIWRLTSVGVSQDEGQAKYILYAIPVVCIVTQILIGRFVLNFSAAAAGAFGAYLCAAAIAVLVSQSSNPWLMRDFLIISSALCMAMIAWTASHREVVLMAFTCLICMMIEGIQEGISFTIDFAASDGLLESAMAFPLGVILLYAIRARRVRLGVLTALLFMAANKRIAILAIVGVLVLEWMICRFGMGQRRRLITIALSIMISASSLFSSQIFEMGARLIDQENVSANSISLGRFEISQVIWNRLDDAPFRKIVAGHGPGAADTVIESELGFRMNAHNDWLKIFFDYGLFGFVIFHFILALIFSRGVFSQWIHLYTAVVMMTDNCLIYTFHHVIVLVVMRAMGGSVPPRTAQPHELSTIRGAA
jgi:hypothetical protein